MIRPFKFLFIFLSVQSLGFAQSYEYAFISNVNQRGQLGRNTCWAASYEMLSSVFMSNPQNSDLQLQLIRANSIRTNIGTSSACPDYSNCSEASTISVRSFPDLISDLQNDYQSFKFYSSDYPQINSTASAQRINTKPDWQTIKNIFRANDATPMLLWKTYPISGTQHVSIISGYLETKSGSDQSSKYLLIYDPWKKSLDSTGVHYALSFSEFEHSTNPNDNLVDLAIFYDFKPLNTASLSNVQRIISNSRVSGTTNRAYKKRFLQSRKRAFKSMAKDDKASLINLDFDAELMNFLNINHPGLNSADGVTVKKMKGEYSSINELNDDLKTQDEEVFKLYASSTDTLMSYSLAYQKPFCIPVNLQPYKSSINYVFYDVQNRLNNPTNFGASSQSAYVSQSTSQTLTSSGALNIPDAASLAISDIQNLISDFRTSGFAETNVIFRYSSFSNKPDILLLPTKKSGSTSFILVDLFNRFSTDYPNNPTLSNLQNITGVDSGINLESFNYKLFAVNSVQQLFDIFKAF